MLKVADLYASLDAEELAALFPYGSYVLINRIGAEDEALYSNDATSSVL